MNAEHSLPSEKQFSRFSFDTLPIREGYQHGFLVTAPVPQGLDAYNPSNAVGYDGDYYHAVRVEQHDNEFAFHTVFFRERTKTQWTPDHKFPILPLQDPFVTKIQGDYVAGGVRILSPGEEGYDGIEYCTEFYRGKTLETLESFARGPKNQKDIRLTNMEDGRVGVLTRPQGKDGDKGQIGFVAIPSLDFLNADAIDKAKLLPQQPARGEWWGANDATLLPNGEIGVIGHVAKRSQHGLHYRAVSFVLSPDGQQITKDPEVIAKRQDFPLNTPKRLELHDVVFSSGVFRRDGDYYFVGGLSDSGIGVKRIHNPFVENASTKERSRTSTPYGKRF